MTELHRVRTDASTCSTPHCLPAQHQYWERVRLRAFSIHLSISSLLSCKSEVDSCRGQITTRRRRLPLSTAETCFISPADGSAVLWVAARLPLQHYCSIKALKTPFCVRNMKTKAPEEACVKSRMFLLIFQILFFLVFVQNIFYTFRTKYNHNKLFSLTPAMFLQALGMLFYLFFFLQTKVKV